MTKNNLETNKKESFLSILWIFVTLNYLYCDIMTLMNPDILNKFLSGNVDGMKLTPMFFLGAAILMEIPMSMVLLSRILKPGINRWANIIAGTIMTVVQAGSLFVGSGIPKLFYVFFSIIEISCTLFIVIYAIRWKYSKDDSEIKNSLKCISISVICLFT